MERHRQARPRISRSSTRPISNGYKDRIDTLFAMNGQDSRERGRLVGLGVTNNPGNSGVSVVDAQGNIVAEYCVRDVFSNFKLPTCAFEN